MPIGPAPFQTMPHFGLSPAFVVSRHGTTFTPDDYCVSACAAQELGFSALQAEIFAAERLPEWSDGGARKVAGVFEDLGLACSQFVAHFLLDEFSSPERLETPLDTTTVRRTLACAAEFRDCRTFTVPVAPFRGVPTGNPALWYRAQQRRLAEKIHRILGLAQEAGFRVALEILPISLIGNTDGFLRLADALVAPRLGLNLDTGHAWVAREQIPLLPAKLNGRLFGLHLKDGDGGLNQARAPGRGTLPWGAFLQALAASKYTGSLDLEIGCRAEDVRGEYGYGRDHLASLLPEAGFAATPAPTPLCALST